jgi:hypothetical protein
MKAIVIILCFAVMFLCTGSVLAEGKNIALGCRTTFDPGPNYGLCTDPDDSMQLTDGKFAAPGFWTDKLAVGWSAASPYHISIDLGKVQPISGVMFSTACRGNAGVLWPTALMIQVSDDGVTYHYIGDLAALDRVNGDLQTPDANEYRRKFTTNSLRTHGRYVVISAVTKGPYQFVDEIEVYAGDDSFLNEQLPGDALTDYKAYSRLAAHKLAVGERIALDIVAIRSKIKKANVKPAVKTRLLDRLAGLEKSVDSLPVVPAPGFKAILPLNDLEASILAVNGTLMQEMGYKPITVWKKHRYDRLNILEIPTKSKANITIEALKNEFRSDSFLITNSTDKAMVSTLKITGIPGTPRPNWLEVSSVPWTDTAGREPVAAALPAAKLVGDGYEVTLPAGMTREVWFTADTSSVPNGDYKGLVTFSADAKNYKVPIRVRVSKIAMSRPRMSLGMWDYSHNTGYGGLVPSNLDSAIQMMQSHFVDAPWASPDTIPLTENLTSDSFAIFDKWVKRWPDARHFMIFANVPAEFTGSKIGTIEFNAKVGVWANALDSHMRSLNRNPESLALLLLDEPYTDAQDEIIAAWAKAIKASGSKIRLFEDPMVEQPEKNNIQEALTLPDILCPNMATYCTADADTLKFWEDRKQAGQTLWFYQCTGPVRTFDPSEYYRMMAWHGFKAGVVGMGFWSFGDIGSGTSSWNEYTMGGTGFAPAFIDPEGITDSVHWQAVREGMEDYEYLCMLRDWAQSCSNASLKSKAHKLLQESVNKVTANYKPDYTWKSSPKHTMIDDYRVRVLHMLESLQK